MINVCGFPGGERCQGRLSVIENNGVVRLYRKGDAGVRAAAAKDCNLASFVSVNAPRRNRLR